MFDILRKKTCDIETLLSIDREMGNIFMNKSCRKWTSKASPGPLFNFAKYPKQPFHARSSFKNKILKLDYQKAFKKLTLFFLSNTIPFNGQCYQKQKWSGTSYQCLLRPRNKFRKIPLIIIYYLTKLDDVM